MDKINLEEGKIFHEGEWLSVEDILRMIQEKMRAGEMKFSGLAAALEELKMALENSQLISVKMIITNDDYNRLKALGKADDRECIRKAIRAFTGIEATLKKNGKKRAGIKCANCGNLINLDVNREKDEIKCPECGARGILKSTFRNR
jgi:DNA-directed RNA polymerase subunit RPC12/RpoP